MVHLEKILNDEQRKEYEKIFEKYFLESFSSRLAEYSNPEIEVVSKKKINENYTMVTSILIATDTRAESILAGECTQKIQKIY